MKYKTFLSFNIVGGVIWAGGLLIVSYYIGTRIPNVEHYLSYIIICIVILSFVPIVVDMMRRK
jgi:membrane-associated protein